MVTVAALIATGVSEEGQREILGLTLGDSENEASWDDMLRDLKSRGLGGVDLVVSDDHKGLKKRFRNIFRESRWQRCQVHFLRNILGHAPASQRGPLALGRLFRADTKDEARAIKNEIMDTFEKKAPKSMDCLEEGFEESLTILSFPRKYRVRLRSTNSQERLNEEVRRRERVIRIFPNEDSAIRLIGPFSRSSTNNGARGRSISTWPNIGSGRNNKNLSNPRSPFGRRMIDEFPFSGRKFTATLGLDQMR